MLSWLLSHLGYLVPAHRHPNCPRPAALQIVIYFQLRITEAMEMHSLQYCYLCNFRHNFHLGGGTLLEKNIVIKQIIKTVT